MLSDVFETNVIHKVLVVATDEDATVRAAAELREYDIDATIILEEHVEDERASYARKLRQFGSGVFQAICMPFTVWRMLREELVYHIDGTNLMIEYELEPEYVRMCIEWLEDIQGRGFTMSDNFLIHLVERDHDQG